MSDKSPLALGQVVETLRNEGHLDSALVEAAEPRLARLDDATPWYVRAMVGFGAWVASLLLIGFVAGFSLQAGGVVALGIVLIVAALTLRWFYHNDFVVQATLATSLAGQALLIFGLNDDGYGGNWASQLSITAMVVSAVLLVVFPDRIHRLLSVLFFFASLVVLMYAQQLSAWIVLPGPLAAAALVAVQHWRSTLFSRGLGRYVWPLENGLMLSAFGILMISTLYLLPEVSEFAFYPRPWISTLLLGGLLMFVLVGGARARLSQNKLEEALLYGLSALIIGAAWAAPGLILALLVTVLGLNKAQRGLMAAGIGFLVIFLVAYFYGIQVSMPVKAASMMLSGGVLLLACWALRRLHTPNEAQA